MMKKALILTLTLLIGVSFAGPVFAMEKGNKRKGKYTYRKVYKACYERGAVEQQKPLLNPDAHSQAEWTQIFENKQFEAFKCEAEWGELNDEDLRDIYTYLHDHASDSPTPAKCK